MKTTEMKEEKVSSSKVEPNKSKNKNKKDEKKQNKEKKVKKKKKLKQSDIKKYSSNQIDHVILKIKANERKYTIITVSVILAVFLISSYFVFSKIQKTKSDAVFRTGSLYYEFGKNSTGLGDTINLVDTLPLSDKEGLKTKKYTVKIRNKADVEKTFQIFISDDEEMIKYDECSNRLTDRKYVKYSVNDEEASYLEEKDLPVIEGVIKPNEELSYDLHVFVGDAYNLNKKVHYHGRIVIKEKSEKKSEA